MKMDRETLESHSLCPCGQMRSPFPFHLKSVFLPSVPLPLRIASSNSFACVDIRSFTSLDSCSIFTASFSGNCDIDSQRLILERRGYHVLSPIASSTSSRFPVQREIAIMEVIFLPLSLSLALFSHGGHFSWLFCTFGAYQVAISWFF